MTCGVLTMGLPDGFLHSANYGYSIQSKPYHIFYCTECSHCGWVGQISTDLLTSLCPFIIIKPPFKQEDLFYAGTENCRGAYRSN